MPRAARNSVLLALATSVTAAALGTAAAVALHRGRFPGRTTLRPLLLPPIEIPYVALVVNTGLAGIRGDLEDAAKSLGSMPLHAFFAVTFPLLLPSVVAAAWFAFAVSLDQFVISYFLATPGVVTLPVQIYADIRKGFTPEINAISVILLAASMCIILGFA